MKIPSVVCCTCCRRRDRQKERGRVRERVQGRSSLQLRLTRPSYCGTSTQNRSCGYSSPGPQHWLQTRVTKQYFPTDEPYFLGRSTLSLITKCVPQDMMLGADYVGTKPCQYQSVPTLSQRTLLVYHCVIPLQVPCAQQKDHLML